MGLIIFGFTYINRPSPEELERQRIEREQMEAQEAAKASDAGALKFDSITPAEIAAIKSTVRELGTTDTVSGTSTLRVDKVDLRLTAEGQLEGTVDADGRQVAVADILSSESALPLTVGVPAVNNLRQALATVARYRGFARHLSGDSTTVKLENKNLSLEISNKGGVISRATLRDYNSYDSTKIELLSPETDIYNFTLTSATQRFETSEFFFTPVQLSDSSVLMKLELGDGARWGIKYTLPADGYLVNIDVIQEGMQSIIPSSVASMDFTWHQKMRRNEAGRVFEERNSALYYMFTDGDVDNLSEGSDDDEEINQRLKWISCKNQFFSAVLMARTNFSGGNLKSTVLKDDPDFIKAMQCDMTVEYSAAAANPASFVMYLGPNSYPVMSAVEKEIFPEENMHLTKLIPLGWPIFRWINTLIIIPVFTLLGSFISNYGIIILLLTIFIKIILFPFTYKSMISQARMRLLVPEIKAINDKYPGNENAMQRQQATMALYSRVGASPFSGCLPMLLQMPVLIAMFSFFPSAIELRGQSFLWAKDLSAPDSIFTLPFSIPFYGNHVSLFCLLMTVVNIIYTKINMANQPGGNSMPGMKWMMYMMPVMFLFFFNDYASGLSYYYFLSLLITIIQTWATRKFIDEKKVRAELMANAKKPKKKSGFMARLEEAQRQQQAALRAQQQKGKRK